MRILITGTSGFVGARLARRLAGLEAHIIYSLGRRASGLQGVMDLVVRNFSTDTLDEAIRPHSIDAIMHFAAAGVHPADRDASTLFEINTCLPARLVECACRAGARAIVIAGSSAEYRQAETAIALSESAALETVRAYGASKAAGSSLALAQGSALGIPAAVVRLFNLYGPGEAPHRLLPSLFTQLSVNRRVALSTGTQVRDFVHVDDACEGLWLALNALLERRMSTAAYNLASGTGCSVAEFARSTAAAMRVDPSLLDIGALPMRADDLPYVVGDGTLLRQIIDWVPQIALTEGIMDAVTEMQSTATRKMTQP